MFLEAVGDVLEEDEAEDDMLVLCRIHVVSELISGEPQFRLETEIGGTVFGGRRFLLGHWGRFSSASVANWVWPVSGFA
jgi:hypothetical protein